MTEPFWADNTYDATTWTSCTLKGIWLPGYTMCEFVGGGLKRQIEKKKSKGTDGVTIADLGNELTELLLTTEIAEAVEWQLWQDSVLPAIWAPKSGGRREHVELIHPLANAFGIDQVYLEAIRPRYPEDQVMLIEIKCFEYRPDPPKPTPKPKPATTLNSNELPFGVREAAGLPVDYADDPRIATPSAFGPSYADDPDIGLPGIG